MSPKNNVQKNKVFTSEKSEKKRYREQEYCGLEKKEENQINPFFWATG